MSNVLIIWVKSHLPYEKVVKVQTMVKTVKGFLKFFMSIVGSCNNVTSWGTKTLKAPLSIYTYYLLCALQHQTKARSLIHLQLFYGWITSGIFPSGNLT